MANSYGNQKLKKALQEFKEILIQKLGTQVLDLKLFGSRARKDFHRESDIDVLVVLKRATKENKKIVLDASVKILLKYGLDISPHIYPQKEFKYLNSIPSVFIQILKREAIAL